MKPVLVLQHLSADGPAYLATWLRREGRAFELRNTQAGDIYPKTLEGHAALAILGGEMSANDDLPSLRQAEHLVRQGVAQGVPVIGHCLGGQLMARALGARIVDSPAPEIGWQPMRVHAGAAARDWFGAAGEHRVFQWHYESFELPPGTELLAGSSACPNQAFALGPHLAMQFHIEVDAEKLQRWSMDEGARYREVQGQPAVQDGPAIRADIAVELARHQALADRLYARWLSAAKS
jgi:GMP synthase-like glutamine amidotransferase